MVMRAGSKAAVRLFKKHIARLITIIAIVIVSIGFMAGIGELENKIRIAANGYYAEHNLSDLYLKSPNQTGFSAAEQNKIIERYGAENVEKSFCMETKENDEITRVYALNIGENAINKIQFLEGELPQNGNEVLVERETDALKSYDVGEKITLTLFGREAEYTVCGIVFNPLYMAKVDEPSFQFKGETLSSVVYLDKAYLPIPFVNDIYITLLDRALYDGFHESYEEYVKGEAANIEAELGTANVTVLSLYENFGFYSLASYAEKVGQIGIIFVVFFLLVTLLITHAAMARLFDEERAQIACQKTLGISEGKIVGKYVLFVGIATLLGGLSSFMVGIGLTRALYLGFDLQYEMPPFPDTPSVSYYLVTFGIVFAATTLLTLFSGLKACKEKPAHMLSAKAPKAGKKVILEKIPLLWRALSFKYKSTLRNVLLFKSRFLMTVVSVLGASVLVFAGMGLFDCALKVENGESLGFISLILIVFSAVLCALVIYNLTNINVSERKREIATLMVLGYQDNEVAGYIFREIYIMSIIGAVFGVPVGVLFVNFVFEFINFGALADVNWWTYLLAPSLTVVFAFLSTFLLRKKITKTDMNASLKTVE